MYQRVLQLKNLDFHMGVSLALAEVSDPSIKALCGNISMNKD